MLQVTTQRWLLITAIFTICEACKTTDLPKQEMQPDGGAQLPKNMWIGYMNSPDGEKTIKLGYELNIVSGKVSGREYTSVSPSNPLTPLRYISGSIDGKNVSLKFSASTDSSDVGILGISGYFEGTINGDSLVGNCIAPELTLTMKDGDTEIIEGYTAPCEFSRNQ